MTLQELIKKIQDTPNSTKEDIRVGALLFNFGLEFRGSGKKIRDEKGGLVGEIDLLFIDKEEDILFLVEVSAKEDKTSAKVNHFFSKWGDTNNIKILKNQLSLTQGRVYRINFDVVNRGKSEKASLNHVLKNPLNKLIQLNDLEYFEETFKAIGTWARNDLYSYLEIKPRGGSVITPAIVFYIGDRRAFIY